MHTNNPWTEGEAGLLRELWLRDAPINEIAERLGRTVSAVKAYRRISGLPPRIREPWTKEEDDTLRELWEQGAQCAVIGGKLDRSEYAVKSRRGILGLPSRKGLKKGGRTGTTVYLSDEERNQIQRAASKAGMSTSRFLRYTALNRATP